MSNSVTIFCEAGHSDKRAIVDRFVRSDDGTWQEVPGRSARLRRIGKGKEILPGVILPPRADKPEAFQSLSTEDRHVKIGGKAMGGRNRYRLACELCGVTVPAREEKLFRLFDRLADANVLSISLAALAARL